LRSSETTEFPGISSTETSGIPSRFMEYVPPATAVFVTKMFVTTVVVRDGVVYRVVAGEV
jgi:hypothetical protein